MDSDQHNTILQALLNEHTRWTEYRDSLPEFDVPERERAKDEIREIKDAIIAYGRQHSELARLRAALEIATLAIREATKLAWEVGCETEDGVNTLLEDSRGDLYRQLVAATGAITAALAGVQS